MAVEVVTPEELDDATPDAEDVSDDTTVVVAPVIVNNDSDDDDADDAEEASEEAQEVAEEAAEATVDLAVLVGTLANKVDALAARVEEIANPAPIADIIPDETPADIDEETGAEEERPRSTGSHPLFRPYHEWKGEN